MKRIPTRFELDQEDIKKAIAHYLNNEVRAMEGSSDFEYEIELSVVKKTSEGITQEVAVFSAEAVEKV